MKKTSIIKDLFSIPSLAQDPGEYQKYCLKEGLITGSSVMALTQKGGALFLSGPRLQSHGGQCCAVKHIYNLGDPASVLPACPAYHHSPIPTHMQLFPDKGLPRQTAAERVEELINYQRARQSSGVIEIITAQRKQHSEGQTSLWGPLLEALGFKIISHAYNSNSTNICTVWQFAYGQDRAAAIATEKWRYQEGVNKPQPISIDPADYPA